MCLGAGRLCVLGVAHANLEVVRMLEHVPHGQRVVAGELLEVVGALVHLALADGLREGDHTVGAERRLGVLLLQ